MPEDKAEKARIQFGTCVGQNTGEMSQVLARVPFRSTISRFRGTTRTRSAKIGMHRMTVPKTELERFTVKGTLYTLHTYRRGQNFGPFRSTTSRFRDAKLPKSEMHRMTPN